MSSLADSKSILYLLCTYQSIFGSSLPNFYLVLHCGNFDEFSTHSLRQCRVVVSQRCHRIASLLRLALTQISGADIHRYLRNAVLGLYFLVSGSEEAIPALFLYFFMKGRKIMQTPRTNKMESAPVNKLLITICKLCDFITE